MQEISKIQHDFAGKVSKLDVEIAKLNEDKDKVIADLESKKEKLISEYKNQNASIIEAGIRSKVFNLSTNSCQKIFCSKRFESKNSF